MTLIIARQVSDEVYIVGDTKFTNETKDQAAQYIGGLKVILLTRGLCVAFAGCITHAKNAIQDIYNSDVNLFDKNIALEHFLQHHRNSVPGSPDETTFIVVCIVENKEQPGKFLKEIFKISESKVHWENQASYIGDSRAFNLFQEKFHTADKASNLPSFEISRIGEKERPEFDASLTAAMRAMQHVIDDPETTSVDGYRTVVISENDQFRYIEYLQIKGKATPVTTAPGSPVTFGGAPEGTDAKHIGMLSGSGLGVFPVYSITGGFGLIYQPVENFEPLLIRDCTQDEFRFQVEKRLAIAHQHALNFQSKF